MEIAMHKIQETDEYVNYEFEVDIDVGAQVTQWETKYGICKFNKITEEFEIDKIKSDPYFLQENNRESMRIHVKLLKLNREKHGFPQLTGVVMH